MCLAVSCIYFHCFNLCFFFITSLQCSLHIHAAYSTAMRLNIPMLPMSEPNAVGLILAHGEFTAITSRHICPGQCRHHSYKEMCFFFFFFSGSVGDAISVINPDVYVSDDGGYTWIKALDGPHHYAILDSGGLLVAVEHNPNQPISRIK